MKAYRKAIAAVLLLVLCFCCTVSPVSASDAAIPAADLALLTEAIEPLVEQLETYYVINDVTFSNVAWSEDRTPNGLYASVCLNMTLLADELTDLPFFQGISQATGLPSLENVTLAQARTAALKMYPGTVTLNSTITADDQAVAVRDALVTIADEYAGYIGTSSDFYYEICVTTDDEGSVDQVYAINDTGYEPLSAYYPQSVATMKANGITALQATVEQKMEEVALSPDAFTIPLYYRVNARDYANTYSSEATASDICEHGHAYINHDYYNPRYTIHCYTEYSADCANFISQALVAGQIPQDSVWKVDSYEWRNADELYLYLDGKNYIVESTFANCNAGGLIFNFDWDPDEGRYDPYHVNMCVHNDTVTRKYSAHNRDHREKVYTASYWSDERYFVFVNTTTDLFTGGGTQSVNN